MKKQKKLSARVRILIILVGIAGSIYWLVGKLENIIASFTLKQNKGTEVEEEGEIMS